MAVPRRTLQSKNGITIRTRKGTPIKGENDPQNAQAIGASNISAGSGGTLLAAPGAGFCWIITSLVVTMVPTAANSTQVNFTGGLAAQCTMPASPSAPAPGPATIINSPFAVAANTSFGYSSSGTGAFSISGTAYKATIATITNPSAAQVIAVPIDSDPAADLG